MIFFSSTSISLLNLTQGFAALPGQGELGFSPRVKVSSAQMKLWGTCTPLDQLFLYSTENPAITRLGSTMLRLSSAAKGQSSLCSAVDVSTGVISI